MPCRLGTWSQLLWMMPLESFSAVGPHLHRLDRSAFSNPRSGCMQGSKHSLCYASGFSVGQNMQLKSLDLIFYRPSDASGGEVLQSPNVFTKTSPGAPHLNTKNDRGFTSYRAT
ncbi:hypothetical protein GGI42DRAFT_336144 [Trichoderma sp. SZMC 28013]